MKFIGFRTMFDFARLNENSTALFCTSNFLLRVSRGFWGTREHGQFQLGNRETKAKYLREKGNKKRFREDGHKALLKGGQKIEKNKTKQNKKKT